MQTFSVQLILTEVAAWASVALMACCKCWSVQNDWKVPSPRLEFAAYMDVIGA